MAIGNPFNGTLRGRLGESVFSRKAGAQHVRAYVQKPANPQSKRQLAQRVKFGTCAKFYQHGVQNLFKFAFEFKKPGQDDYNAFLQANVGNVPCNTRKAYNAGLPNLGNYIMSQGSLPSLVVNRVVSTQEGMAFQLETGRFVSGMSSLTIGELSKAIIGRYGLRDGDFITTAVVSCVAEPSQFLDTAMNRGALTEFDVDLQTRWDVKQFMLDSSSFVLASTLGIFTENNSSNDALGIAGTWDLQEPATQGVCVMASRNTSRGVKVSTSRMICNTATEKAIEVGMLPEWTLFCADTFVNENPENIPYENILQGSITSNADEVTAPYRGTLPVALIQSEPLKESYLNLWIQRYDIDYLRKLVFNVSGSVFTFKTIMTELNVSFALYESNSLPASIGVKLSDGQVLGSSDNATDKILGVYIS